MIDLVPWRVLPKGQKPSVQQDFIIFVSSCLCLSVGMILGVSDISMFSDIEIFHFFHNVRQLVHPQQFPCPFCGGTRAFLFCCEGDFFLALRYSITGFIVFWWLVLNLPLRGIVLLFPGLKDRFRRIIEALDSSQLQIIILIFGWLIQIVLHLTGIMSWYPAIRLI